MSWRDAPLYVKSHDLSGWVLDRANTWELRGEKNLGPLVSRAACQLVEEVAIALTFPETRAAALARADVAIVILRIRLRLAHQLGLLPTRGLRFACGRLREIGRMVGGWRRRVARSALRPDSTEFQETGRQRRSRDPRGQLLE